MKKLLITDAVHPLLTEGFNEAGYQCDYHPNISREKVLQIIKDYTGIIINSKIIVDRHFLDTASQLKFIGRLGSGLEIIDLVYAKAKEVAVHNSPEGNRNAVGEHTLAMLLCLSNKLLEADREVRDKHWDREKNRGFEIMGKTIGIIGFGHTGSSFASKLLGFKANILAYDKYKINYATEFHGVKESTLEEIQENSDIISLHLPLTKETTHIVNSDFINKCKSEFILINASRGKVVHTKSLVENLKSKRITGACLDVFENEKPKTFSIEENKLYNELYQFPNVVLSPHIAGWTQESKRRMAEVLIKKIL